MATTTTQVRADEGGPTGDPANTRAPRTLTSERLLRVGLPLLLVALAAFLRFVDLGDPPRIYFDETYYAGDANEYLQRGVEEEFAVHPPVGKWVLAAGIALFGNDSFGFRAGAAFAGTLTVLVTYLAALRLFRQRGLAALAALLVTLDGLALTMSRIAMLDVTLALFVVTGFWLLLVDRDRQWALIEGLPPPAEGERRTLPSRSASLGLLAGLAFGLGFATKWSAMLAIAAAGLFVLGSELAWRKRITGRFLVAPWRIVASGVLTLLVVPTLIYVASYASWFSNYELTRPGRKVCSEQACNVSATAIARGWWKEQRQIVRFHLNLEATHPYRASALTWPVLGRPVAYYYETCKPDRDVEEDGACQVSAGKVAAIHGLGNPAIWWTALLAYPVVLWGGVVRRDWRAWAILLFILLQYVPWLFASRPVFLFYATPIVPFMALALVYAAERTLAHPRLRWAPAVIGVLAVGAFVFWYPVLAGLEISEGAWRLRMLLPSWI